jgi:thiol-disulfide isomerase/thioredoxin
MMKRSHSENLQMARLGYGNAGPRSLMVILAMVLGAGSLGAQDTTYVPATEMPNGKQIVVAYMGASWCGPCRAPRMKAAVLKMKPLVAAQARQLNASFAAMVVALDRNLNDGLAFIASLGPFDEYIIGEDMAGSAAQRFVWTDATPESASVPEVFVIERTVTVVPRKAIKFSADSVLKIIAGDSIPIWVANGAPIK